MIPLGTGAAQSPFSRGPSPSAPASDAPEAPAASSKGDVDAVELPEEDDEEGSELEATLCIESESVSDPELPVSMSASEALRPDEEIALDG